MDTVLDVLEPALGQLTYLSWIEPYVVIKGGQRVEVHMTPDDILMVQFPGKVYIIPFIRTANRPLLLI